MTVIKKQYLYQKKANFQNAKSSENVYIDVLILIIHTNHLDLRN